MAYRRASDRTNRVLAVAGLATTAALLLALGWSWAYFFRVVELPTRSERLPVIQPPQPPASPLEVQYRLELPGRGEIFPALATGRARDYWPVAVLTIVNTSDRPIVQRVTAEIPGWSRPAQENLVVPPRQSRKVELNPELLPRALENAELRRASLVIEAGAPVVGGPAFSQSRPVLVHSAAELYWGTKFANAQFIARWVTPHEPAVLRLVSEARRFAKNGRLGGYNPPADVRAQAQAVYKAMQRTGISYVSSIFTFGEYTSLAQRIRFPRETLALQSANCIDVSVAFAAAMENIGLKPFIVIVPGHAFTGVRLGPNARDILYLDLTVLPKGSFEAAVRRAEGWMKKTKPEQVLLVDVAAARALGIYPLAHPEPVQSAEAERAAEREAKDEQPRAAP